MATPFRIVAAALGWFALALQFSLQLAPDIAPWSPAHALRFFSFFTILSNILVALALTLPVLAPRSAGGAFFARPTVRTAVASYIVIVFVIYHWLLAGLRDPQGLAWVADALLHKVMPIAYVLDWLLFVPKGSLIARRVLPWLVFPLAYVVFALIQGAINGFYPYPFINAAKLGYASVFLNALGITCMFAVLGLLFVAIDRALDRR